MVTAVGMRFREVEHEFKTSTYRLEADPENQFDNNAIKIVDNETEQHVAYVSRETQYEADLSRVYVKEHYISPLACRLMVVRKSESSSQ